jgi:Tol biopolymer transport system component
MVGNGVRPQVVSAQSGPRTRLIWETEPGFDPSESNPSPDGRYIAFSDWSTGDLWVRDLTTGASHRLTNEGYEKGYAEGAVISPDSSQIVYRWDDTKESYQLRIVPTTGGAQKTVLRITQPGEYFVPAGWTPDGKRLLVIHGLPDHTTQLALLSTAERTLRPIKSFSWQRIEARLSPDGRYIAYSLTVSEKGNARDIFILATEGSRETAVVENPADDFGPVWSPDGSRLLFLSDRTGTNSLWSIAVEAGKPKGDATLIKRDIGQVSPLGMSRSGTYYYFVNGNSSPNIYSAELDPDGKLSKAPTLAIDKFIGSNVGSSISPDGKRLAYTSNREGQGWVIVIRALETGEDREVPKKIAIDKIQAWGYGPMWFPDGHSLLVPAIDPKQRGTLMTRVDSETGAAELLHRIGGFQGFALSRDGRSIYYTKPSTFPPDPVSTRLVRFDIDQRKETELKAGEFFITVAVSPDSKQLAYVVGEADYSAVAVMPTSGGASRLLYRGKDVDRYNTLAWTPDQKYLLFGKNNTLWRLPVAGGGPEEVGVTVRGTIRGLQFHPDGGGLYYTGRVNGKGELWALENFLSTSKKQK